MHCRLAGRITRLQAAPPAFEALITMSCRRPTPMACPRRWRPAVPSFMIAPDEPAGSISARNLFMDLVVECAESYKIEGRA